MDVEVDIFEKDLVGTVAKGDIIHLYDGRRELFDIGKFEVYSVDTLGRVEDWHALQFLDAGLRFGTLCGVVAELVDERLQMSAFAHLLLVLSLRGLAALFFGRVERVEVCTFVVIETFRVLVNDVCGNFVQEGSVVRYNQDCAGVAL